MEQTKDSTNTSSLSIISSPKNIRLILEGPKNYTYSFIGDINFTNLIREEQLEEIGNTEPTIFTSGNGIFPIKNLIVKDESKGDYEIYNTGQSGGGGASRAIKLTNKTATVKRNKEKLKLHL